MSETTSTEAVTEAEAEATSAPVESAAEGTDGQPDTSGTDTVDRAAYDALKAELDGFKRDVVAITGRYAEAHNLCSVTDQALAELGLRRVQTGHRVSVTLNASWDIRTTSRGRAGAPSESTVWRALETLASAIRYDSVDEVKRRYASDNSDFPNLKITTADVSVTTMEPAPDAHIIPPAHRYQCSACGYNGTADTGGTCRNCGEDLTNEEQI